MNPPPRKSRDDDEREAIRAEIERERERQESEKIRFKDLLSWPIMLAGGILAIAVPACNAALVGVSVYIAIDRRLASSEATAERLAMQIEHGSQQREEIGASLDKLRTESTASLDKLRGETTQAFITLRDQLRDLFVSEIHPRLPPPQQSLPPKR